ncbi:papilin [Grus japonensis]|uniref:Papilin n=1 Tax=Grus japonensis TaxID=30415 RepID=A0ABC9WZ39_GRUJA
MRMQKTNTEFNIWNGRMGEGFRKQGDVDLAERRTEGASSCVGPTRSYRSCNVQSCPEGSRDFRAEQCAEFDGTEFQGKKYKWLPYYGAPNKCELNCIPKGENFYYRHKEAVVDGTTCEPGKRDICVEGACKAVGCDNMLESSKKEDKCLQCGGDGSTCYGVKGTFDVPSLPKGYNQIFIIPVGATSIQIKEVMPSRNFLAVKNVRGEYYLNGHWTIDFSRALHVASTVMHYDRGSEGDLAPELLHARGPTTEPLVIELISQEPNPGVQYEYYLPVQGQASGYSWSYGSWSECSSECGGGFQSRLVFCTIDNEIYPDYMCRNKPQPDNNRTCGRQTCPHTKRAILEEAKPSLVTAVMGQSIQLVCKTGLSPFSRVEWMKDGRPVSSDRLRMDKSEPSVVEANVGERIRLPCTVEASPALTIEWQKDGQPLSSPRHRQQSDGALVISRVSSEDVGFFTCIASNGRDQDQRQVLFRPLGELRITGLLPSIMVPEGGTAQLHCTVTGNNVNIRWSRNGVPMRADGHHIHLSQDGSLIISNVQGADEGSYTCSAYSSSNSVSASTEVKVLRSRPSPTVNHVVDLSRECVDQPHLANCDLILQAQLCSNEYYSSFCCASCSRYQPQASPPRHRG